MPGNKDSVESVQVPGEVPEASLATEATVNEHVEAIDSKQGRVPLAAREYVQGGVAEPDVAHHIWGRQSLLDWLGL